MPAWSLFAWLIVGAVVGWTARRLIGGKPPFGTVGDILLGIAGGVVGGLLAAVAGLPGTIGGLIGTLLAAVLGALVLIWLSSRIPMKSK